MYYLYMLMIAIYSYSPCLASERSLTSKPVAQGIDLALRTMIAGVPQGLVRLNEYNQRREYDEVKVDDRAITTFLNKELKSHCINPADVTYFVGAEGQDWEFIKLSPGYGLVIPEATASLTNFVQRLLGLTKEIEPEHRLNIKRLSDLLSQPMTSKNESELQRYRLAIVKAVIKAASQSSTQLLAASCAAGAINHAISNPAISQGLSNAISALSYVYHLIPAHDQWVKFQQDLDTYMLESADLDLILAHIEDLEEQYELSRGSYSAKILAYLPLYGAPLEQRIQIIKNYLHDNITELTAIKAAIKK